MKVAVLGLGPSISLFSPEGYDLVIGVNDIWKFYPAEVVVCIDERARFDDERMKTIDECRPKAFYTQLNDYFERFDFHKIELLPNLPDYICQLNLPKYPKSMCSPFVACAVAYKDYNATEIHLYGVDLIDHPHLTTQICSQIKIHFYNMLIALRQNGSNLIVHGSGILSKLGQ